MDTKKKRKFWSAYQIATLRRYARERENWHAVARKMRRSHGAVRQKACALGIMNTTPAE